jgi:hypothetical protein
MALPDLKTPSKPPEPPVGFSPTGGGKEALTVEEEKVPIVERKEGEIPPEIKDYVTKVETAAEVTLPQPVTDDSGQIIVDTTAPQSVTVTLPLTEEETKRGLQHKMVDSLRWLAEWCRRLLKLTGSRFVYRHGA